MHSLLLTSDLNDKSITNIFIYHMPHYGYGVEKRHEFKETNEVKKIGQNCS